MEITAIAAELSKPEVAAQIIADEKVNPVLREALKGKGFHVLSEQDRTTLLENHKKTVLETDLKGEVSKIYSNIDADLEALGYKKNPTEKTYEAVKRVIGELKGQTETLSEQVKKGLTDEQLKAKITEVENQAKTTIADWKGKYEDLLGKQGTLELKTEIGKVGSEVSKGFKETLSSVEKGYWEMTLSQVEQSSKMIDGVLTMVDKDGNPLRDSAYHNLTAKAYLDEKSKELKAEGSNGGAGSSNKRPATVTDPTKYTKDNFPYPAGLKVASELTGLLLAEGLVQGTPQFTEVFAKGMELIKANTKK